MNKHTPGPWFWHECGDLFSSHGNGIGTQVIAIKNDDTIWVKKNDAQLIAAAPDLLEALKELRKIFPFPGVAGNSDRAFKALDAATKAINKATGEQP